jgi:hypothetical protein
MACSAMAGAARRSRTILSGLYGRASSIAGGMAQYLDNRIVSRQLLA